MNRNASSRLEVPAELTSLLLDFTVSVLVNKPADLLDYAATYFSRRRDERTSTATNTDNGGHRAGGSAASNHMDEEDDEENDSFEPDFGKCLKKKPVF